MIDDVKQFAEKFHCHTNAAPGFLPDDQMKNRLDFQLEELLETAHAAGFYFNSDAMEFRVMKHGGTIAREDLRDLPEVLDGLVDQVYVALGTAVAMGFSECRHVGPDMGNCFKEPIFKSAWARVHAANMQKVNIPGVWKTQKPAGWVRPNLEDLVK